MSDMRESALWLYGPWPSHNIFPGGDDMFPNREKLQRLMADPAIGDLSLRLELGYVHGPATGRDELPTYVSIASDPKFEDTACLPETIWRPVEPETLLDYPVVLDHWLPQMRLGTRLPDGLVYEQAGGVGLPPERLINAKNVQNLGNRKDLAEKLVLQPIGVGLTAVRLQDFGAQREEWLDTWGDGAVIFKVPSGAKSHGVRIFDSVADFETAMQNDGELPANGFIQPFMDLHEPIPDLKPLTPALADQLNEVNSDTGRVRELRLHAFVSTVNGRRNVEAYPTLRTSAPGVHIMKGGVDTPLDPEAFEAAHPGLVEIGMRTGHQVAEVAGVPHLYGVADVSVGTHPRLAEPRSFVGDLNVRGAFLPDLRSAEVTPAQLAFIRLHKTMARIVLEAA